MTTSRDTLSLDAAVYQPKFGRPEDIVEYSHTLPMEHLSEALGIGRIVVAEAFHPVVADARSLEVFQDKLVEERRSAHGVTFGRLLGAHRLGEKGKVRHAESLPVALKPFSSPEDAVSEMRGYTTLRELGVPTFEPVGIFPAATG